MANLNFCTSLWRTIRPLGHHTESIVMKALALLPRSLAELMLQRKPQARTPRGQSPILRLGERRRLPLHCPCRR